MGSVQNQGFPQATTPVVDPRGVFTNVWFRLLNTLWSRTGAGGGGDAVFGGAVLATTAVKGFLYLPTCAGVPTGVPLGWDGQVAAVYDTTNNKLYVYNGAWIAV